MTCIGDHPRAVGEPYPTYIKIQREIRSAVDHVNQAKTECPEDHSTVLQDVMRTLEAAEGQLESLGAN